MSSGPNGERVTAGPDYTPLNKIMSLARPFLAKKQKAPNGPPRVGNRPAPSSTRRSGPSLPLGVLAGRPRSGKGRLGCAAAGPRLLWSTEHEEPSRDRCLAVE